ncbi:hypothetical protein [Chenggangzhangella methanolivorans]|uniref:Uncharacterized protein n=1 Tax=Chenggangzhangella methanolivorans TaxID=1437009 RepID=A0A9E6UN29_9HYPH|nr:hypothetical protein [Chenggangzhangella methanolivorans]QZN99763.1 hypothetical protein K6K41_24365 [Chenggangzhangella methanolivorans]
MSAAITPVGAGAVGCDALAALAVNAAAEGLRAAREGQRFAAVSAALALDEVAALPRLDLAPLARRSAAEIRAALGHSTPRPRNALRRAILRAMHPVHVAAAGLAPARIWRAHGEVAHV